MPSQNATSVLLTGAAGFVGFHVAQALLKRGLRVIGVDSLTEYYPVELKRARLAQLQDQPNFSFHHVDIADQKDGSFVQFSCLQFLDCPSDDADGGGLGRVLV